MQWWCLRGVFILAHDNLRCQFSKQTVSWHGSNGRSLALTCYKLDPKEDDHTSLTELQKSLGQVSLKRGNFWLISDFNLPGLLRTENSPSLKPEYVCKPVYDYFIERLQPKPDGNWTNKPWKYLGSFSYEKPNPDTEGRYTALPGWWWCGLGGRLFETSILETKAPEGTPVSWLGQA